MKRLVGALMLLSMLHLSWVRGDVACAHHSHRVAATSGTAADAGATIHMTSMRETSASSARAPGMAAFQAEQPQPCDTPTTTDCCAALSSCGSSFDVGQPSALALLSAHDRVDASYAGIELAGSTGPATPPPRRS